MRTMLILFLFLCAMGPGVIALTGCKNEKQSMSPAVPLLLMGAGQQQTYFPEIPKGVAE